VVLKNAESKYYPISSLGLEKDQLRQIERFVLNTRGELLFSNITILAEGESDEQALNIFFKEYFCKEPFELGVSIVGVGGKNYLPFLCVLESIGAEWYIFSDGEPAAINDLQLTIQKLEKLDEKPNLKDYPNIIVLENSTDLETYLLANEYDIQIIKAINDFEYNSSTQHKSTFFEAFKIKHHGDSMSPKNTGKICEKCGQSLKDKPTKDYLSEGGEKRALCDCMKSGKAKYAAAIATTICEECDGERKFPPKILDLMIKIKVSLGV
jgi:putative ATP-dependent endonuclease of OLD family